MSGFAIFGVIVGAVAILSAIGKALVWLYALLNSLATKEETAKIAIDLQKKVDAANVESSRERVELIDDQNKVLAAILEQTKKTNGTVLRHDVEIKDLQKKMKRVATKAKV